MSGLIGFDSFSGLTHGVTCSVAPHNEQQKSGLDFDMVSNVSVSIVSKSVGLGLSPSWSQLSQSRFVLVFTFISTEMSQFLSACPRPWLILY